MSRARPGLHRYRFLLPVLAVGALDGWACSCGDSVETAIGALEGVFRDGQPADAAPWTGQLVRVVALTPTLAELQLTEGSSPGPRAVNAILQFETDVPALQQDPDDVCRFTPLSPMLYERRPTPQESRGGTVPLPVGPGATLLVQPTTIRLRWQEGQALVEVRWLRTEGGAYGP